MFATSDLITYVVNYNKHVARALGRECELNLTEYRIISYLSDHVQGHSPSKLAKILRTSAATVTLSANELEIRQLVLKKADNSRKRLAITKAGIDAARDADLVLAQTHEEYFSALTPQQKAVVDVGSMITNKNSAEGNRMRDGHFFSAFETLQAFLVMEELLTNATRSCGLSLNGFRMLFELSQREGAARLGELGYALLLPPATTCYVVDRLAVSGFAERTRTKGDGRSNTARLTDEGRRALDEAVVLVEAVFTTDLRSSGAAERDSYKDAASLVVSSLQKRRANR